MTHETVLILGAGQAGGQCAASLRRFGWEGAIILAGEENHPPYQRPPLSKAYLLGDMDEERLWLQPPETWDEQKVQLKLGVRGEAIDRAARSVRFDNGDTQAYDHLVIATGARIRPLPVPGAALAGVRYLRGIGDVSALREDFAPGRKVAIIGGGYIGLEAAAVAKKRGAEPVVIEAMDRLLARVAAPEVSGFYRSAHEARGVTIRPGAMVEDLTGTDGHVTGVQLIGGEIIPCDRVLIGIGVLPNEELAAQAGLTVSNGIDVDAQCRTSDPAVFAIGDCVNQVNWLTQTRIRLESVPNAIEQGKHAAAAISGAPAPRQEPPWFWSDQFELKLQSAGLIAPDIQTITRRGEGEVPASFFHLKDGVLIAADCINDPPSFMGAKMMIAKRARPDASALADPAHPMKDIMKAAMAAAAS